MQPVQHYINLILKADINHSITGHQRTFEMSLHFHTNPWTFWGRGGCLVTADNPPPAPFPPNFIKLACAIYQSKKREPLEVCGGQNWTESSLMLDLHDKLRQEKCARFTARRAPGLGDGTPFGYYTFQRTQKTAGSCSYWRGQSQKRKPSEGKMKADQSFLLYQQVLQRTITMYCILLCVFFLTKLTKRYPTFSNVDLAWQFGSLWNRNSLFNSEATFFVSELWTRRWKPPHGSGATRGSDLGCCEIHNS